MRLLLDTHALLWSIDSPQTLSPPARAAIADGANVVAASAANVWEIEIKRALAKLEAPEGVLEAIQNAGFDELPITLRHAYAAGRLPRHHDDPFDRMLVAQAQLEGFTLVTRDGRLAAYGVAILAA